MRRLMPHRTVPNRTTELRQQVQALVQQRLGSAVICSRCYCTLATFADKCEADLAERCPGFNAIDAVQMPIERQLGLA